MPDSFYGIGASLAIEQGSQTKRHPLSIDTPSTLSPVRLSVQGGQNQPEPTPALEALYRGFERELMVLLGTEIGDLCRYTRSRRLRRMSGAGSGCWSSPTKPGISYRWAVAASAVRSPWPTPRWARSGDRISSEEKSRPSGLARSGCGDIQA